MPPESPLTLLQTLLPAAIHAEGDALPASPGAYALLLRLDHPVEVPWRPQPHRFIPGDYIYAGNAYGPGGIRARVGRHLRRDKRPHWHIDQLTAIADTIAVLALAQGQECAIIATLVQSGLARPALKGFGSSDCRICDSHLLVMGTCGE